jgi:hypothetical protein
MYLAGIARGARLTGPNVGVGVARHTAIAAGLILPVSALLLQPVRNEGVV